MTAHRPVPVRVQAHCRVDCSCGWRGPKVPMFGQGHLPWVEHFKGAPEPLQMSFEDGSAEGRPVVPVVVRGGLL